MTWKVLAAIGLCATVIPGCVSTGTHDKTLAELDEARKTSAQTAVVLASVQKQSAQDIKNLEVEQRRLTKGILSAQRGQEEAQSDLETTQHHLANVHEARRKAARDLAQLREERLFLQSNVEDLTQRLSTVEQELASSKALLGEADARVASLEQEEARLTNELWDAQDTLAHTQRFLESAEQRLASQERGRREAETNLAQFQEKNERLEQSGDTLRRERDFYQATVEDLHRDLDTAQTRLAGVEEQLEGAQARMAALEPEREGTTAALAEAQDRADFLEASLAEERAQLAGLEEENQRLITASITGNEDAARGGNGAVAADSDAERVAGELVRLRQEREELSKQVGALEEAIQARELALAQSLDENNLLEAQLQEQVGRLNTVEGELSIQTTSREELSRLGETQESERARLQEELREALDAEIAKGQIRIQQLRDQLMIDVVDHVLFDSGRSQISQDGLEVLKRVSAILKDVTGKHIRIEGHTDTVPIGLKLVERYPSNWELSTARATSVLRYMVDNGGLEETNLSATGYAYNRPVASNDTAEGRAENRRIEIVLYPKDLSEVFDF